MAKAPITTVTEMKVYDPELGWIDAVVVTFEYPPGKFHTITLRKEEYSPGLARKRVGEWVERYGELVK